MLDLDAKTCLLNVVKRYIEDLGVFKKETCHKMRKMLDSPSEIMEDEVRKFTLTIGYIDNQIQNLTVIRELYSKDLPF